MQDFLVQDDFKDFASNKSDASEVFLSSVKPTGSTSMLLPSVLHQPDHSPEEMSIFDSSTLEDVSPFSFTAPILQD